MWGLMQDLVSDLRLAGRSLRKAPVVMLITVVSLGFGIGAMTVVFGVAENLLFGGSTGIEDPATLVGIYTSEEDAEPDGVSSYRDYRDILAEIDALQDVAAISLRTVGAGDDDAVRPLLAEEVTGNFFSVTGIQPVHGRAFRPEEASIVAPERVVLISWDLWQREYDGDPGVLGRTLRISGNQHTIIGVVPDEVVSRRSPLEPDLWLPMGSVADEAVTRSALLDQRQWRNLILLGRLADGATQETLDGQLAVLADRLHAEYPDAWQDDSGQPRYFTSLNERDSRLKPGARRLVAGVGGFFLGAAGLILLIACANVTTLFLGRAANRSREMAVRATAVRVFSSQTPLQIRS